MKCTNCGSEMPDTGKFCLNCGEKLLKEEIPKRIQLRCKECDGVMDSTENNQALVCPYCGAKELIMDSDAVAVQKIKSETEKEIEYARMEKESEKDKRSEEIEARINYAKSKLKKYTMIFLFISVFAAFISFSSGHIVCGLIALLQIGAFGASWLLGMKIVHSKIKYLHSILAFLGFILILAFLWGMRFRYISYEKLEWPEEGLASVVPKPYSNYGEIILNNKDFFKADINKVSEKDYKQYIKECKDKGCNIDIDETGDIFIAYSQSGERIMLAYDDHSSEMSISVDCAEELNKFTWPNSEVAKLIPIPKSLVGKIETNTDKRIVIKVGKITSKDCKEYIEECYNKGFNTKFEKEDEYFSGYDQEGNHVKISYEGNNTIVITVEKADKVQKADEDEAKEPNVSEDVIDPTESEKVIVDEIDDDTEDVQTKEEDKGDTNGVDPDLKAFLDSYEAFMDEYVDFMKKYMNDPGNALTMLADYTKILEKYEDFTEKIDAYDTDEMSTEDAKYYLEVINRCNQKMLEIY